VAVGQHATLGDGWIRHLRIVHGDAVLHRRAARQHGVFSLISQIIIAAMIAAIKASALRIVAPDEGTWCCRSGLN
jgi:hypothetical protein